MEARSRDKLGQPIGIKSGRIGTPRDRTSLSLLFSKRAERGKTGHGERWKNGRVVRSGESRSKGARGRGNRAPPTRKLIDTIN